MIEQVKHSISTPIARRASSMTPGKTISLTSPSELAFGIQLNTPQKLKKKQPKKSKKKKKKKENQEEKEKEEVEEEKEEEYDPFPGGQRRREDSKYGLSYCSKQARRRSSYYIGFKESTFDELTFNVSSACREIPINLFEIGKIIDVLKGKKNGWILKEYLSDYQSKGLTSPIFEISHPQQGRHLVFGVYPRLKEATQFLRYHPILQIVDEYGIDKIYSPVRYTKKSGFNYIIQTLIQSTSDNNINIENLGVIDEEYTIINKEFHKQCEKLFDKILYGKGVWKRIPGVDSVFITHWNTFMRKYRDAVEQCYLNGDLKGYILLVSMFWAVVLRFKKQNRCKDLSKVLSRRMSYRICRNLQQRLNDKHNSISLISLNLLFRPNGIFQILKQNGWNVSSMDEEKIIQYRNKRNCAYHDNHQILNEKVQKVAKHAGKVMAWSRNQESCLIQ